MKLKSVDTKYIFKFTAFIFFPSHTLKMKQLTANGEVGM